MLSSAVATSIVNTVWENGASYNPSELSGELNGAQSSIDGLMQYGMSHDQAVGTLTNIAYGQAVMFSTNQVFLAAAGCFLVAAVAIWLAPSPARVANPPWRTDRNARREWRRYNVGLALETASLSRCPDRPSIVCSLLISNVSSVLLTFK